MRVRDASNSKEPFVFLNQLWKLYKASCPDPPYNKEVRKSNDWHYVSWVEGFLEPAGSHKNNSINLWSMFNMPHLLPHFDQVCHLSKFLTNIPGTAS